MKRKLERGSDLLILKQMLRYGHAFILVLAFFAA